MGIRRECEDEASKGKSDRRSRNSGRGAYILAAGLRSFSSRLARRSIMRHRALGLFTLVLAALGLAPGAAHLMELPVKLNYTPQMYAAVTSTLYAVFGSAGAAIQVAALVSAIALAYVSRELPGLLGRLQAPCCWLCRW
jgi:hypothetical protein